MAKYNLLTYWHSGTFDFVEYNLATALQGFLLASVGCN